jgi:transcriptional regulator with XRE-family HTH domain
MKWKPPQRRIKRPAAEAVSRDVAQKLYQARVERGLTLQDVADALGRTRQQVDQWESGKTFLTLPVLTEWAMTLGFDVLLVPSEAARPVGVADDPRRDDARFFNAFRAADQRTRDGIAVLLGIDRPPAPPIEIVTRRGRPSGVGRVEGSLRLTAAQLDELRASAVPFTGNKLITALKIADARVGRLAAQTRLTYARVAGLVQGKLKAVPLAQANELAACFGCEARDLFPGNLTIPTGET